MQKKIINQFIIISSLVLFGCAHLTDSQRTEAEGTAAGAGIGALLGGILGKLIDGDEGAKKGAALGALIGGIGGNIAGKTVAERKQQYANEEDRLDGEITVAKNYNAELREYNSKLTKQVQKNNQELRVIMANYKLKKASRRELHNYKTGLDKRVVNNNNIIGKYKNELVALQEYQASIPDDGSKKKVTLQKEIKALQIQIANLDNSNQQLAKNASDLANAIRR